MSDSFAELLNAAIQHLELRKSQGERWVRVDTALLDSLSAGKESLAPPKMWSSERQPAIAVGVEPEEPKEQRPIAVSAERQLGRAEKEAAMQELRERTLVCQKCPHLVRSRRNVVFGVGDIHSPLMFVGEAPGMDEDARGEPFVGRAGQLLTRIIQTMGFSRETVYIANVLKCRPDTPGQTKGNRKPTPDEMATCLPYLSAQIDLVRPKVIVALGATAVEGLLGLTSGITRLRGRFQNYRGIAVMPTYHPSYLLHNQVLRVKREVWEDMLQVMEKLGVPISEKQRNFFLKSEPGVT